MNWISIEHYAYAILAVAGTLFGILLIRYATYQVHWLERYRDRRGIVAPFINVTGTLFALTLTFIANDTWDARDRAIAAVFREAEALRSLMILSETLPAAQAQGFRQAVQDYGVAAASEWPFLRKSHANPVTTTALDNLLRFVSSRATQEAAGENIHSVMMNKVLTVREERDQRISLTQVHLNPLKWFGMALLGFLTLVSIALVHLDNLRAGMLACIVFACAAAPSAAIVLVQGNPFQQPAAVSPAGILQAVGMAQ